MSKKTVACIDSRFYVPSGWIAITFCDIDFSGYNSSEFESDIQEDYDKKFDIDNLDTLMDECESKIESIKTQINTLENKLQNLSFFAFADKRDTREKIEELEQSLYESNKDKEKIENMFPDVYDEYFFYKQWLENHNFIFDSKVCSGDECTRECEKYVRIEN